MWGKSIFCEIHRMTTSRLAHGLSLGVCFCGVRRILFVVTQGRRATIRTLTLERRDSSAKSLYTPLRYSLLKHYCDKSQEKTRLFLRIINVCQFARLTDYHNDSWVVQSYRSNYFASFIRYKNETNNYFVSLR